MNEHVMESFVSVCLLVAREPEQVNLTLNQVSTHTPLIM